MSIAEKIAEDESLIVIPQRTEAQFYAEHEPEEIWVNAYMNRKTFCMDFSSSFETEEEAFADFLNPLREYQYLYTMKISKTRNSLIRDVSAFNMTRA
jgi:hypothetical protein